MLATDLDSSVNIEDWLLRSVFDRQELLDLSFLILLDVTVEQECCVVLVVVDVGLTPTLGGFLISDQLLKVLDQVIKLCDLNVVLNDIAGVQKANRLNVLLDGFIVLFLLEKFVSVLLDNLTLDLTREVSLLGNGLRLSIVALLHKVVDLDVVLHREKLDELTVDALTLVSLCHIVDAFLSWSFLDLHIDDSPVSRRVPVHCDLVLKVVNRELRGCCSSGRPYCSLGH